MYYIALLLPPLGVGAMSRTYFNAVPLGGYGRSIGPDKRVFKKASMY